MLQEEVERIVKSVMVLAIAVLAQIALGIMTLLAQVPLNLALAHQALAVIVFGLAVWHRHRIWQAERQ